jgi:hypothetical protein
MSHGEVQRLLNQRPNRSLSPEHDEAGPVRPQSGSVLVRGYRRRFDVTCSPVGTAAAVTRPRAACEVAHPVGAGHHNSGALPP